MSENEQKTRRAQRLDYYLHALKRLREGISQLESSDSSLHEETRALLIEGIISRFHFTHELAWKILKDCADYQGFMPIAGPRDATRYGLRVGLINDEQWMNMIKSRNITSHRYDETEAKEVYKDIVNTYLALLLQLEEGVRLSACAKN